MKRIKLYYSIPDLYPAFRVDLSELVAKSLRSKGLETTWLMVSKEPISEKKIVNYFDQPCLLTSKFVENGTLPKLVNKFVYWFSDVANMLSSAQKDFDILQVRDKYIVSLAGLLAAKVFGKKFVYWCSYPFPEHYLELAKFSTGFKRLYCLLHGWLAKVILYYVIMPLSDHVFVQTERLKQDILDFGVPAHKMTAVPMGVPQRLLDWVATQPISIVPNQIVYIGIMTPERHLDMLIDAFAMVKQRCPAATLLMVGDGVHPSERIALEHQVTSLGLTQSVRFTGFVPLEEAWGYAASGAVCVSPIFPSSILNCGSPTKLYEYMALGRPVVCNHHPEQTVVISETKAGFCVDWDATQFAEACIWMLEHPREAEAMATQGPAWVHDNRSYDILAEVVWKQYQQILGKK